MKIVIPILNITLNSPTQTTHFGNIESEITVIMERCDMISTIEIGLDCLK